MDTKYCKCGCGQQLDLSRGRKNKQFIHGHHVRVKNNGAKSLKGKKPWNKGVPRTEEEKNKMSEGQKRSYESSSRKVYVKTEQHKQNLINSAKKPKTKEHIQKILTSRKNNPNYEQTNKIISETLKRKYLNGELTSSFYIDGRYVNDPNSAYNLYNKEFTEELKLEVRKRDNWTCKKCNKKRSTCCHHINENKKDNRIENLITLCNSCHAKYHSIKNLDLKEKEKKFMIQLLEQDKK
jgi:hypothetical protein